MKQEAERGATKLREGSMGLFNMGHFANHKLTTCPPSQFNTQ